MSYTDVETVKRYLRFDKRFSSSDIEDEEIGVFIVDSEIELDDRFDLAGLSSLTTAKKKWLSTLLCAYNVYLILYPTASNQKLPDVVEGWKKKIDDFFENRHGHKIELVTPTVDWEEDYDDTTPYKDDE